MRRGLLAFAGLVACGGGHGADVEIHADGVTFTSVELYVTYDRCKTPQGECPSIGWPALPTGTRPIAGDVWVMNPEDELAVPGVVENGSGILHLEASPGFENTKAIAIVAFDGRKAVAAAVLHDKTIPIGDQEHWYVTLEPTDPVDPANMGAPSGSDHRALAWARESSAEVPDPAGYAGCFAYQDWTGSEWKTEYFVPSTDPDCDGDAPDCDPTWNHAPVVAGGCFTRWSQLPAVCVVGIQTCVDEGAGTCNGAPICVPDVLCQCWDPTTPSTSAELQTCIRNSLKDTMGGNVPAIYCPYIENPDTPGFGCDLQGQGERMTFVTPGNCASVDTATPIAVLRPMAMPFSGGSTTLQIGTATFNVHATSTTTACLIDLAWAPDTATPTSGQPIVVAINYGAKQIIVPVYVDFKNNGDSCPTGPTACMRFGDWPEVSQGFAGDTMFQCTVAM